jgi:hypothetical protein
VAQNEQQPPEWDELTDPIAQHALMWREYKRIRRFNELAARTRKCLANVALVAGVSFGLLTGGKAAWDVVKAFLIDKAP